MKIATILSAAGLIMLPVIGLAQTSNTQVAPIQPTTSATSPPTTVVSPPQTTNALVSPAKCGVNTFMVYNECGAGVYKNVYAQCYDGFEVTLGEATSCKPAELWDQYAKEACANHCSTGKESYVISKPLPRPLPAPAPTTPGGTVGGGGGGAALITSPVPTPKPISVCYISGDLMQ